MVLVQQSGTCREGCKAHGISRAAFKVFKELFPGSFDASLNPATGRSKNELHYDPVEGS